MRIGTMFLGRVDALDHESVQTKFLVVGVPLFPIASYYATAEHANGVSGMEIPIHGGSVLAGYARIGTAMVALLTGLFGWLQHRSYSPQYGLITVAVLATIAWVASTFLLGRLSQEEQERRRRLRAVTGLGAPPSMLPEDARAATLRNLELAWQKRSSDDWRTRLRSGAKREELPILYALASYAMDDELVAAADRATR